MIPRELRTAKTIRMPFGQTTYAVKMRNDISFAFVRTIGAARRRRETDICYEFCALASLTIRGFHQHAQHLNDSTDLHHLYIKRRGLVQCVFLCICFQGLYHLGGFSGEPLNFGPVIGNLIINTNHEQLDKTSPKIVGLGPPMCWTIFSLQTFVRIH